MSQLFDIHPENPQVRLVRQACVILREGGVIVYPTDSGYALGCMLGNRTAIERIRKIRHLSESHNFTLVCSSLSEIALFATVNKVIFRILKTYTPGPYTFILKATREVPKKFRHPNRKTIGIRIPDNNITLALLDDFQEPIISSTLILPGQTSPLIEPEAIQDIVGPHVDLIISGGYCGMEPTTVVDLTQAPPKILRVGKGDPTPFEST